MAYYEESLYLDLSKEIYSMEYKSLVPEDVINSFKDEGEDDNSKIDFSTNAYLFFKEKALIRLDILNLCKYVEMVHLQGVEVSEELAKFPFGNLHTRVNQILQKYHEQPALLDKSAKFIIVQIMDTVKRVCHRFMESYTHALKSKGKTPKFPVHTCELLKVLNILIGIRGTDRVTRHFPHEAQDFEPLIFTLTTQKNNKDFPWEANFVLLNWLSLILLMPFDLEVMDSRSSNLVDTESKTGSIIEVIVNLCKHFLGSTSTTAYAASECLGKLFSRKDIREKDYMERFVDWAIQEISIGKDDQLKSFFVTGLFSALDHIFKLLAREELMKVVEVVYKALFKTDFNCFANSIGTVRHNRTKLAQRMALTILRPKVCTWMHRRTKKSLLENFKGKLDTTLVQTNVALFNIKTETKEEKHKEEDEGLDDDVDLDILEDLIGFIFDSLKDKETVIRWTAAKSIGRITQRLDLDLANDIVNEIIDTFLHAGENEWHGGLMALGELSRRGLLLPENLSRIIHILKRGLIFEVSQGTYTTGSNVRDAACYVAWAFSRAFEPEIMQPFVTDLASSLLLCALYDKEASCRRAAAAAFQENVGRQGNFPRGIEIITEADYFSLGVRNNAYLVVSLFVAHYKEYYKYFVEHLAKVKLFHCDLEIRRLTAATLSLLSPMDPEFMINEILPPMVDQTTHANFYVRHGAVLGVGEILIGLAGKSQEHNLKDAMKDSIFLKTMTVNERKMINPGQYMKKYQEEYKEIRTKDHTESIPAELKKKILHIVGEIETKRLYRGKGGDDMRKVVCRFIHDISLAKIKMSKILHNKYMDTIDENLRNLQETIVKESELALLQFSDVFHKKPSEESAPYVSKIIEKAINDPLITTKRGYTLAATALSKELLTANLDKILELLKKNTEILKKKTDDDPDLRNYAVKGLKRLLERLDRQKFTKDQINLIIERLIYIMDDYSVDRRGDIGSIVRETGMYAILHLIKLYTKPRQPEEPEFYNPLTTGYMTTIIGLLLQQLVEKIDRMRLISGSILQAIFDHHADQLPDFPHKQELAKIFSNQYLREQVKKDQERIDVKFDVSLVDTTFLDYDKNESLIYFWDMPQCVFPRIIPLLTLPAYSCYILRGLCLSLGGITASTSDNCVKAVDHFLSTYSGDKTELAHRVFTDFFTILEKHKKVERFITPILSTFAFFYRSEEFFNGQQFEEEHFRVLKILQDELIGTKYSTKLIAGVALLGACLNALLIASPRTQPENLALVKEKKGVELMSYVLNHEFPVVAKASSEALYLLLSSNGEKLLPADKCEALIAYLTSKDWLMIDITKLEDLKKTFEDYFAN